MSMTSVNHVGAFPHLADIGVEVGHAQERAIAEGRERIEHVVARKRAVDAVMQQPVAQAPTSCSPHQSADRQHRAET